MRPKSEAQKRAGASYGCFLLCEQDGDAPELVETSDDDSDVESVDEATSAAAGEVLLDAPRRYPALPAVTYARPGILGPEYPPYALLDEMDYSAGANRVVLFDIGYYDAKVIKGGYTCFLLGCDYKTHGSGRGPP